MLQEINDALESTGQTVFYGKAGTLSGEDPWDYIVFYRTNLTPNETKRSITDGYTVAIVQEEFVEDTLASAVIKAMTDLPGMKLAGTGGTYQYATKPNTETVIEILYLDFVRPSKVCHG